ncbi:MAG TPA: hypothetical protein VM120_27970 [Bryobacteraceae bacterium]|nr:hypothetical protein [Bryobacteraceae bacterium]
MQEAALFRRYVLALFMIAAGLLLAIGAFNYIVDPFGYWGKNLLGLTQQGLSEKSHDRLFKLARFRQRPKEIIVLGDSRAKNMKEEMFASRGLDVSNLAFGGGTLYEALDAFWYANSVKKPRHVIIGLPFNLWSEANSQNRVAEARALLENPVKYHLSYYVTGVSMRNLVRNAEGRTSVSSAPPMSREEFWRFQLGETITPYYKNWRQPKALKNQFWEVVQYCRENGIGLTIVIPPTHRDLQRRVGDFGLNRQYSDYLSQMKATGQVMNFEAESGIVNDRSKFEDPFHASPEVMDMVVGRVAARMTGADKR